MRMAGIEMKVSKRAASFISKDGILSREDCSETDTALCDVSELTLKNIANTSTLYRKTSSFSKNTPIDFNDLGITDGNLSVGATLSSAWRRRFCRLEYFWV